MTRTTFSGLHTDRATDYLVTLGQGHNESHSGNAYFAVYSVEANNTDLIEVRMQTPDTKKWAHMSITIDVALAGTAQLWKGTTKTHVTGNAMNKINRNHNSSNTSGLTICHTPGGSESASSVLTRYIGAASTSGRSDTGGTGGSRGEFILAQNTAYLIRVTSRANANALTILLDWYEHRSKEGGTR